MKNRLIYKTAAAVLCAAMVFSHTLPTAEAAKESAAEESILEESASEEDMTVENTMEEDMAGGEPEEASWPQGPSIMGEAGILMEASTGAVLYSKNIHAQYYPASITKLLTALIILENCEMDEMVRIPHEAVYMEDKGSHIALDEDEELTVEDCLYGMLLASANDAAYALAVHEGGSIENFAAMMNERARELGCQDSNFVNPNGLPDERHVTSAYDMALITREVLKFELFRTISGTDFYEIQPSAGQPDLIPMSNHHKMLIGGKYHYDGAFAGKTGYTVAAGNTLVTCAQRDGMELICVTMKTQGRQVYVDTAALFDFGFENFKLLDVGSSLSGPVTAQIHERTGGVEKPGSRTEEIPVQLAEDCCVVVPDGIKFTQLASELFYDTENAREGQNASMTFYYGDHQVGQAEILLPEILAVKKEIPPEQETDAEADTVKERKERGFVWWYIPLGILAAGMLGSAVFLLIRRQIWRYRWQRRREKMGRNCGRRHGGRRRG